MDCNVQNLLSIYLSNVGFKFFISQSIHEPKCDQFVEWIGNVVICFNENQTLKIIWWQAIAQPCVAIMFTHFGYG
jgi:hypothetical protein